VVGEPVGVEPFPEPGLRDALGVVVLIPEQREDDHRFAEVDGLGGRVVPAVSDHQIDHRQDSGLRQELRAPHVLGEF
jgi:hypothetical protein